MPPTSRKEVFESLLRRLDIPQIALYSTFRNPPGIGPHDQDFFVRYEARRLESEDGAIRALEEMSDYQLLNLADDMSLTELRAFAFDHRLCDCPAWYSGGFGARAVEDFDYWIKLNSWTLNEAVCLSIGFPPQEMPAHFARGLPGSPLEFFWKRHEMIRRALPELLGNQLEIVPALFAKWAARVGLEMPNELVEFSRLEEDSKRPEMLKSVDLRRFDSSLRVVLALLSDFIGFRGGPIPKDAQSFVNGGLKHLGLKMDPKTIKKILADAENAYPRFLAEQQTKDESQD